MFIDPVLRERGKTGVGRARVEGEWINDNKLIRFKTVGSNKREADSPKL